MNLERSVRNSFEEAQFSAPETHELSGGSVKIFDVRPGTPKTDVPVVLAPGWVATPEVFRDNMIGIAKKGRRAISVEAPHGIDTGEKQEGMPEAELRKVLALIEALDAKDLEKVDVVAHSEAAIYTCFAAKLYPDRFRNMVLVNPAGMIGSDTFGRLARDFGKDKLKQTIDLIKSGRSSPGIKQILIDGAKSLALHFTKSYREVEAMTSVQIHDMLREIKKDGHGIVIVHTVDDKAFPMDRVQKTVSTPANPDMPKKEGQYADMVDGFYSARGTHNQIIVEPDQFTTLVDSALDSLEKKYAKIVK